MMKIAGALGALALALSSAASGDGPGGKGKPDKNPDPPAEFVPEILYRVDQPKGNELRFGNRSGDQAVLIVRGEFGESFDASTDSAASPQPNVIAYTSGGVVRLVDWSNDDGFTLGSPAALSGAPGNVCGLAFSNGDDRIAVDHCGTGLSTYSIPEGDIHGGSWTTHIGSDFNVIFPRWSPDDESIYFFGGPYVTEQWVTGLYRHDLASGQTTLVLDRTNDHDFYLDVARTSTGDTLIVTALNGAMQLYDTAGNPVASSYSPEGSIFRFNCDASAVLHSRQGRRGTEIVISGLSGGTSVYADQRVRPIASWMTRSPCL